MADSQGISWYSTIRMKLIAVIILTTTLVLGVAGYMGYKYTETTKTGELNELATVTADRLSEHLVIPMWDVDFAQVSKLLEAEMREARVEGIVVRDEDGKSLFAAKQRDANGEVIDSEGAVSGDLVNENREVFRNEEKIGTVSVFVSRAALYDELAQFAKGIGTVVLALNVIILVIMALVLGRVLIDPLRKLAAMADRMSRGELNQQIDIRSNDEIGHLATAFDKMQSSLRVAIRRLTKAQ